MCRKTIPLWEKEVPFYNPKFGSFKPELVDYNIKDGKKHSCVIVIPGGGYSGRAEDHEGRAICRELNKLGIAAFILRYRVSPYMHPCMETDLRRAIRLVRFNSESWNIKSDKIGILGFSAGGHLACMGGLRFAADEKKTDEIDAVSARPDNVCSCYAVASLDRAITHSGTRTCLLGEDASDETAALYSSENIVPDDAPPFFIWHTEEDKGVDFKNSMRLACALADKKIPFELNIFPWGDHGLGLAKNIPITCSWWSRYAEWLEQFGFLDYQNIMKEVSL